MADMGGCADEMWFGKRTKRFFAFVNKNYPKGRFLLGTLLNHFFVAFLKDVQTQRHPRKED